MRMGIIIYTYLQKKHVVESEGRESGLGCAAKEQGPTEARGGGQRGKRLHRVPIPVTENGEERRGGGKRE